MPADGKVCTFSMISGQRVLIGFSPPLSVGRGKVLTTLARVTLHK